MNVFEDLIGELKEENLLEETVFDVFRANDAAAAAAAGKNGQARAGKPGFEYAAGDLPEIVAPVDEHDFYRKRAMDEVSSLQMVEHVLSGVEREQMKSVPVPFDDLEVKKALHRFLQASGDLNSKEHAETEYALLQETESWSMALAVRDKNITVANIRRFCENSRPVLSSQALMALARFYRNSAYSEAVRGKFDFVMTRLFSRETGEERRRLLFSRTDMMGHVKTLYANWSSLSLYSSDESAGEVAGLAAKFDAMKAEAEAATSLDAMIGQDIFNRARLIKESANEMFFAPPVAAAAIDCNISLGNKFIDLVYAEREKGTASNVGEKYGYTYDQIISNAAGKTLRLVDLLKTGLDVEPVSHEPDVLDRPVRAARPAPPQRKKPKKIPAGSMKFELLGVNKWLLAATILIAAIGAGLYFWAGSDTKSDVAATAVSIDISGTELRQHIQTARASSDVFYGIMLPSWDKLSEEEQKQVLQQTLTFAESKRLKKVNLLNANGRTVGFASPGRIEISRQ